MSFSWCYISTGSTMVWQKAIRNAYATTTNANVSLSTQPTTLALPLIHTDAANWRRCVCTKTIQQMFVRPYGFVSCVIRQLAKLLTVECRVCSFAAASASYARSLWTTVTAETNSLSVGLELSCFACMCSCSESRDAAVLIVIAHEHIRLRASQQSVPKQSRHSRAGRQSKQKSTKNITVYSNV